MSQAATTANSPIIGRPICGRCGSKMMLARISSDRRCGERRTFNCLECGLSLKIDARSADHETKTNRPPLER